MKKGDEKRFLIVKTSSLGDIIQAFDVLNYLHRKFPDASIDWIVEERFIFDCCGPSLRQSCDSRLISRK